MTIAQVVEKSAQQEQGETGHAEHVAHHFESAQQQFDAGKLGMWLFLVTEILFFSGLFVAYAVYRANHPEVFVNAHKYLNTTLGAFNTIVLLVSSLTMAWAVRSAQLNQKRNLVALLALTLACASLFLGVKAVEYSHKWDKGLLWAGAYTASDEAGAASSHGENDVHHEAAHDDSSLLAFSVPAGFASAICALGMLFSRWKKQQAAKIFWSWLLAASLCFFVGVGFGQAVETFTHSDSVPAKNHAAGSEDLTTNTTAQTDMAASESAKFTGVFF